MIQLLDVNVLVALAWPNHVHHALAHQWFASNQSKGWATCALTQSGFVRVSSNRRAIPQAQSPQAALALLEQMLDLPGHHFWIDDTSLVKSRFVARERLMGYRQITDAHLLALARRHGGQLATFDRGVRELLPGSDDPRDAVALLH